MMAADAQVALRPARRSWRRLLTQFSLRTLLLFMTAASVACWWFLQPQMREEQYGQTPLRIRRQVRLVKYDEKTIRLQPAPPTGLIEVINGQQYLITNA